MRTIIEISNDHAGAIHDGGQEVAGLLAHALVSDTDADWAKLRPYGIRRIVERHLTESAKVVVGNREIQVP